MKNMKYLALSLILLLSITLIVRKYISNKTNILSINFKLIIFRKQNMKVMKIAMKHHYQV